MPIYQINFVWQLHNQGWTEQYYRQAPGHVQAADLGGELGLRAWTDLRAAGARLQALRVIEQGGLEPMYLRFLNLPARGELGAPDVTATAAVVSWEMGPGGTREMWLRGLPDSAVRRMQNSGVDDPHPRFIQQFRYWRQTVQAAELRGRRLRVTPWQDVIHLGLGEPGTGTVLLRVDPDMGPLAGQQVYFGGQPRRHNSPIRYDHSFLVVQDLGGGEYLLAAPWPGLRAPIVGFSGWRVRKVEYEYPLLHDAEIIALRHHDTARAYVPVSWFPQRRVDIPIHPCGRITDVVRQTEVVAMRFFRADAGRFDRVQWYQVEDLTRPVVPWPHVFYSRAWSLDTPQMLLGEDLALRQNIFEKDPVGLKGTGICGSMQQWALGCMVDDAVRPQRVSTGQPCCCGPGVMVRRAGALSGGEMSRNVALLPLAGGGAGATLEGWRWASLGTGAAAGGTVAAGPALTLSSGGSSGSGSSSGHSANLSAGGVSGGAADAGERSELLGGSTAGGGALGTTIHQHTAGAVSGGLSSSGPALSESAGASAGGQTEDLGTMPGDSCGEAPVIAVGTTYGPFAGESGVTHWFNAGNLVGAHHCTLTITDFSSAFDGGRGQWVQGTTCMALGESLPFTFFSANGEYCFDIDTGDANAWFTVFCGVASFNYTILVEEGEC